MMKHALILLSISLAFIAWGQDSVEVVNIENPYVRAYLEDDTYLYDNDYRTSVVKKYYTDTAGRLDYPAGKLVTWNNKVTLSSRKQNLITVSENENFTDSVTHTTKNRTDSSYVICNMLPGKTYYYKVEQQNYSNVLTEVARGMFRTEGRLRMIRIDGMSNLRDLGGWPTSYGVPIKYGIMYRSGNLESITTRGKHDFKNNLKVGAELDMRDSLETKQTISKLGVDVDYARFSTPAYHNGLCYASEPLSLDMQWLIDRLREGKVVNWHCAVGCDRCGTLSFLIGGLLGMSEEDLCRDYELSTFSGRERTRHYNTFASMLPCVRSYGPKENLAQCFYNYWLAHKISPDDLNFVLHIMLGIERAGIVTDQPEAIVQQQFEPVYYNIGGTRLNAPQHGINIVRQSDGRYTKVWIP